MTKGLEGMIERQGLIMTWLGFFCFFLGAGTAMGLPLWLLYKLFFVWLP